MLPFPGREVKHEDLQLLWSPEVTPSVGPSDGPSVLTVTVITVMKMFPFFLDDFFHNAWTLSHNVCI